MKRFPLIPGVLALGPVFIAGCAFGPTYTRPAIETPAAWKEGAPATTTTEARTMPPAWWRVFEDPELNALEVQVVVANPDLQRAMARVTEARALAGLSTAELMPSLSAGTSTTRQRASENRANGALGPREFNEHRTGFDLGYEIDLWGRNRRAAEAARADVFAEVNDYYAALLTLTADAARHYFELRAHDAEKRVIEGTLALRRDTVRLQTTRNQAGLINEVDLTRARVEVANVEAELHAVTRNRARLEHALAVLSGQSPASFTLVARSRQFAPPSIPAGLPSELLQRRPDVATAEQRLEAALARIAVAKADFFPRIALTGSAGFASAELGKLTDGGSGTWSFGPSMHLPLFDGGRNRANLAAAGARFEQSAAAYRGTVLNAFREVEDALSDLGTLAAQGEAVERALRAARDTAALATERYQRGLSNYLDVVDAQRGVFQAERQEAQLHGQRAVSTILLAKAVGGGWARQVPEAGSGQ